MYVGHYSLFMDKPDTSRCSTGEGDHIPVFLPYHEIPVPAFTENSKTLSTVPMTSHYGFRGGRP